MSTGFTRERQLRFIEEFLAGLGTVEDWQSGQPVIPVRFFNLRIDLDTRKGDLGQQFARELDRLVVRFADMRRLFDQARTTVRFSGGPGDDDDSGDDDDDED